MRENEIMTSMSGFILHFEKISVILVFDKLGLERHKAERKGRTELS